MKKAFLLICILLTTYNVSAQFGRQQQGRQRQSRFNTQPQIAPNENQKAQMEKKNEIRQQEYIASFLATLEADEFLQEITKQTITDYYVKIKEFIDVKFESQVKRKDAFKNFQTYHFAELKKILSESDNVKLDAFLDGKFSEKAEEKKKKKKRKRKNKKN